MIPYPIRSSYELMFQVSSARRTMTAQSWFGLTGFNINFSSGFYFPIYICEVIIDFSVRLHMVRSD